jgi:hypothetical protein
MPTYTIKTYIFFFRNFQDSKKVSKIVKIKKRYIKKKKE